MKNFLKEFNKKLPTSMKMGNFKPLSTVKVQKKKSVERSPSVQTKRSEIISKELIPEKISKENYYMTQQNYFDAI